MTWQTYNRLNGAIKQTFNSNIGAYLILGYGYPTLLSLISIAIFYDNYGMHLSKT